MVFWNCASGGLLRVGLTTTVVSIALYLYILDENAILFTVDQSKPDSKARKLDSVNAETLHGNFSNDCNKSESQGVPGRDGDNQMMFQMTLFQTPLYHVDGLELYMHTAHYDTRFHETNIRSFGIENKHGVSTDFTCRWTESEGSIVVSREVHARKVRVDDAWPNITTHYAVEIDCPLPDGTAPETVDIGPRGQDFRIQLPVNYYQSQPKKTVAVCVKPVTGRIDVGKLVEWFELLRLTGVEDFVIYDADVAGTAKFVFEYYVSIGVLRAVSFPFIAALLDHVDGPHMRGVDRYGVYQQSFLVAMQDCFYRFQHKYEYLLFLDLDEVLLPSQNTSIQTLVHTMEQLYPDAAAFMFLTAWHFEELSPTIQESPEYKSFAVNLSLVNHCKTCLYMQKNAYATFPQDIQPKSIVYPPHTVTVNFHGAHDVPDVKFGNVRILEYDKYGYIHHFRGPCLSKFDPVACRKMQSRNRLDESVIRYRDAVVSSVRRTMDALQLH